MMAFTAIVLAASMVMFSQISQISSAADVTSVCDAGPIVISDSEVHYMTSPNFPSNYPNNLYCSQLIIAPNGGGIKVTVEYAVLGTDGDNLQIYNGQMRQLAAITGTVGAPITYNISNPIVYIQFYTLRDNANSGFNLTYQVYLQSAGTSAPPSTPTVATSVCDEVLPTILTPGEVYYLTSPNFTSIHSTHLDCSRLILAPNDTLIKVTVLYANLVNGVDYIVIFDGFPSDSTLMAVSSVRLQAPVTFISSGRFMFIRFIATVAESTRFNLTYEVKSSASSAASSASTTTSTTATTSNQTFPSTTTMTTTSSVLTTASTTVATSASTTTTATTFGQTFLSAMTTSSILTPASTTVATSASTTTSATTFDPTFLSAITTSSILTPPSTTVATSASTTTSTTATTLEETLPTEMTTSSILTPASTTVATSVATTEAATTSTIQFTQKLSSATITTSPSVCDVTNTTTSSVGEVRYLTSPNYPSGYDNNLDCWRLIIAPDGAVIKVTVLYAEMEPRYDYLNIYDGMSNSSNLLAGISGTLAAPASFNSSGQYLLLHFHTDYNKVNSVFNLTYEVSLPQTASTSGTITTTPSGDKSATGILTDHIILFVIASVFVAMMIETGHLGSVL